MYHFPCLACSPCRSGPFSGSVSTVEDDYSRATLGKQSGMDSRQSVPEQKTDSKCLWLLSFYFAMRVITRTKERTGKEHDMRYFCFRPWWYEIPLLLKKRRMKQHMYLLWLSPHASIDRFLLPYLYSRFLVSSLGEKKLSISKGVAGRAPSEVRKSWTFSSGLPCHKRRRSTYIEIISSGGTVLLPLSTNVSSISEQTALRFLNGRPFDFCTGAPSLSERHVVVRMRLCQSSFDKVARVFWKAEKASPNFALVGKSVAAMMTSTWTFDKVERAFWKAEKASPKLRRKFRLLESGDASLWLFIELSITTTNILWRFPILENRLRPFEI